MLQYQPLDVITDGKTFQMTVSKAYDITGLPLYQKTAEGEIEYLLPSTTHVYAFEVNAVSLYGDTTVIKDALYVPNNSSETFKALDSSIRSMKYDNMPPSLLMSDFLFMRSLIFCTSLWRAI